MLVRDHDDDGSDDDTDHWVMNFDKLGQLVAGAISHSRPHPAQDTTFALSHFKHSTQPNLSALPIPLQIFLRSIYRVLFG